MDSDSESMDLEARSSGAWAAGPGLETLQRRDMYIEHTQNVTNVTKEGENEEDERPARPGTTGHRWRGRSQTRGQRGQNGKTVPKPGESSETVMRHTTLSTQ